jgi:hypothetical protein
MVLSVATKPQAAQWMQQSRHVVNLKKVLRPWLM